MEKLSQHPYDRADQKLPAGYRLPNTTMQEHLRNNLTKTDNREKIIRMYQSVLNTQRRILSDHCSDPK